MKTMKNAEKETARSKAAPKVMQKDESVQVSTRFFYLIIFHYAVQYCFPLRSEYAHVNSPKSSKDSYMTRDMIFMFYCSSES